MIYRARNVAVLGSTGSIGRSTLDVIRSSEGRLKALALTAHRSIRQVCAQAREMRPRWVVVTGAREAAELQACDWPGETEVFLGAAGIERVATHPDVDVVVAAIVGSAGLRGAWAALEAGKTLALANKETLVVAGPLVMKLAQSRGATLLPVDSEHSAVFQAMQAGRPSEVKRIVLTASGGPFRSLRQDELENVSVEQALAHPTWDMGKKITIDSATMMNKALEIIEARWLFDLDADRIDVVVHPQSIVHSLVEFCDGSLLAQLSPPDMRLPIQYALTYPERLPSPTDKMDLTRSWCLDFEPPDMERFPALLLGYEVARSGGTAGAVLNAANEAAVAGFLEGHLRFTEIVPVCRTILEHHDYDPNPTLDQLFRLDAWAREEVTRWVCT